LLHDAIIGELNPPVGLKTPPAISAPQRIYRAVSAIQTAFPDEGCKLLSFVLFSQRLFHG
jgi:hypothetical protein